MRIDSGGRVGIGTSSPQERLHVATGNQTGYIRLDGGSFANATNGIQFRSANNSHSAEINHYASTLFFYTSATEAATERMRITQEGDIGIGGSTVSKLQINSPYGSTYFYYNKTSTHYFDADNQYFRSGNGTERIRIASTGFIGINTTPDTKLHIRGSGGIDSTLKITCTTANSGGRISFFENALPSYDIGSTGTNNRFYIRDTYNNADRFVILAGGDIRFPTIATTATAGNAYLDAITGELLRSTSSLRYKTEVENMWNEKGSIVYNLRPVWYRSKCQADKKDWSWYGLIAEEVAQLDPRLVTWTYLVSPHRTTTKTIDGKIQEVTELDETVQKVPDGVQYDRLTVFLIKALQDLKNEVDTLKAQLNKP